MSGALLPTNSTRWEIGMADVMADFDALAEPIERIRTAKLVNPSPSFVPFLIHEYGLGELTPYVPNHYDLIRDGIRWQRVRGTPAAVALGLSWLAMAAAIKEARPEREFWNSFQLYLTSLPPADRPDLERIEAVSTLSVPLRSKLRRGVHLYDVPALVADRAKADGALLDTDSGVALPPSQVRWSFGRLHDFDYQFSEIEAKDAGFWAEYDWAQPEEAGPIWSALTFPWSAAVFPWVSTQATQRQAVMANWFVGRELWAKFIGPDGEVVGYRRARALGRVAPGMPAQYSVGEVALRTSIDGLLFYVEARTDFGDGAGAEVSEVALVIDGQPAPGLPPGRLWLAGDTLAGGTELTRMPLPITLRETVRERLRFLLRFDVEPTMPKALAAIGEHPNALSIDFTDNSFAARVTTRAELALGEAAGLAIDFTDNSFAART